MKLKQDLASWFSFVVLTISKSVIHLDDSNDGEKFLIQEEIIYFHVLGFLKYVVKFAI